MTKVVSVESSKQCLVPPTNAVAEGPAIGGADLLRSMFTRMAQEETAMLSAKPEDLMTSEFSLYQVFIVFAGSLNGSGYPTRLTLTSLIQTGAAV